MYRYELEIQSQKGSFPSSVTKESLFYQPSTRRKPFLVFERGSDGTVKGSNLFPIIQTTPTIKVRPNTSVISTYAQLGHQIALEFQKALQGFQSNLWEADLTPPSLIFLFRQHPDLLKDANRELRRLDLRLLELTVSDNGELIFKHQGLNEPIPWGFESNGTQSFIRSFPRLWIALNTGGIAVLDELDASIHPEVLREIISWFWDPQKNRHNAQLFFSCHNVLLLNELQKEEILLCEKTPKEGYTRMYRLADIKGIRKSEDFVRGYWHGAYGALPNIG
ncbi:AAA family ATPase [Methylacidiphilum kamchatkense]|uniref:Putative AbiEii toxin of type IV toxin-antitoxin system n=1 Tax=Methylacidiphilum kamchatkense Kam1 TaxID=1202785 RepID=A0A516TPJ5_9BACT|nr:ATP-binding protein [Methylacidiphilum kamchatkense]QDQ43160.1 putative AbiEii toxin of type IV toxin-antitoxin system [Methylacidiphilum kamchatkense Kam1]